MAIRPYAVAGSGFAERTAPTVRGLKRLGWRARTSWHAPWAERTAPTVRGLKR